MMFTLSLPVGVKSKASIQYKGENRLLENAENIDDSYVNEVLLEKMKYNLESIKKFEVIRELVTMVKTVVSMVI